MLEIDNISVSYGKVRALKNVSLSVKKGEIVSIIGANGAGKSTMLKTVSGIVKAQEGKIAYNGVTLPDSIVKIAAVGIAHVPEGRRVFPGLSIRENLIMGGYLRPWKEIEDTIQDVFKLFPPLEEREKQLAGTLSGGEQQMLAIGRGVMSNPKLMLFDEPSLGLAPLVVKGIFEYIQLLNKERDITMILVEQNAKMAFKIAHRVYVLENGEIRKEGLATELRDDPTIIASYLTGG